ncbi:MULTISPECIES: ABC transporter ATP-binding protein [unclassified Nocardioides]|uniref:ABC transporter ATP-binding protein n=1 Tax=Nocardioides sp. URHA0032 TaxID=1380388 RepID=UPI000490C19C|nr:ABC transporter ATP-binding protein [Nocardioides sp. URHA0032]
MLEVRSLRSGYGHIEIVRGLDLSVAPGEVVALVGRNGAGKSTLVNSLMGFVPAHGGSVHVEGRELTRAAPHVRSRAGLAVVPQGRRVFGTLTVEQTLDLAGRSGGWDLDRVAAVFPRLAERRNTRARNLSGGEQSALAMARALATGPRILLLDEPSEGMSPQVLRALSSVIASLRDDGAGVLLVEQNLAFALTVADRVLVMARGHIALTIAGDDARADPDSLSRHLVLQSVATET